MDSPNKPRNNSFLSIPELQPAALLDSAAHTVISKTQQETREMAAMVTALQNPVTPVIAVADLPHAPHFQN